VSHGIYTDGRYVGLNPTYHVADSAWKAGEIHALLQANGVSPDSVVEVGCGAGEILVQLQSRMPTIGHLEGWDVSPDAIRMAKERSNDRLSFHLGDFLAEESRCDALLCIDVMEHVEDYIGFLRRLRDRGEWKVFHIPLELSVQALIRVRPILRERSRVGHLHHFTKETALQTLGLAGYDVISWKYTAGALDLPDKSLLQRAARLPRRALRTLQADLAARWLGGFSLMVLTR
jgi:SAM-dependent methyltransferase